MPPWAIGASSPSGIASTKSRAWAISQRRPQLLVGGVRVAVAQVAGDGAGEQVRPSAAPGRSAPRAVSGSRSRTSTPSTSTAPGGGVEQPGHQVDQRASCRRRCEPMIAVVWPGRAREGDVAQHRRRRRPGRGTRRRRSSSSPRAATSVHRVGRRHDRRLGVEHLADPLGADRGARDHHQHERRHHHRHQDLHQVGQERGQRADLHLRRRRPGAPPNQSTATLETLRTSITVGNIVASQRPARTATVGEVVVGLGEPRGLVRLADERADHPDAGDLLAQHPVDRVDARPA